MEPLEPPSRLGPLVSFSMPQRDNGPAQTLARCLDAVLVSGMELVRRAISGALNRQSASDFEAQTPGRSRQAMARWLQGSLALLEMDRTSPHAGDALKDLEALGVRLGFTPGHGVSILAEELFVAVRPLATHMPRLSPGLDPTPVMGWFCLCAVGAIESELEVRLLQPILRGVVLESWPELVEKSFSLVAPEPAKVPRAEVVPVRLSSPPEPRLHADASLNRRDLLRRPSRERERQVTLAVTDLLQRRIEEHTLPESVSDFLHGVWVRHLRTTVLRDGRSSPRFMQALGVIDDLVWTLDEHQTDISRDQLALRIPAVVQTLDSGARAVGLSDAQLQPFMDALFVAHMRRMQRSPARTGDALARILREIRVDDCPEAARAVPVTGHDVSALKPGDWIQMQAGSGLSRMKVAWFNADRSVFLLVRAEDRRAVSLRGFDLREHLSASDRNAAGLSQGRAKVTI